MQTNRIQTENKITRYEQRILKSCKQAGVSVPGRLICWSVGQKQVCPCQFFNRIYCTWNDLNQMRYCVTISETFHVASLLCLIGKPHRKRETNCLKWVGEGSSSVIALHLNWVCGCCMRQCYAIGACHRTVSARQHNRGEVNRWSISPWITSVPPWSTYIRSSPHRVRRVLLSVTWGDFLIIKALIARLHEHCRIVLLIEYNIQRLPWTKVWAE